ncbi:hypothetical protein EVAR_22231_1 [Eumeta japonica]|uniref:Uncharacterized protein n=1 Tax=Eumeta variegata TaxID=151549 RepID=A0A4C1UAB0_EUMVA|nr:hypothetical protein EVAR_22231_1 [Eumeta japonica]
MRSEAGDRARHSRNATKTVQGAHGTGGIKSTEGDDEELNTSKNDSTTGSSSPEGGDVTARGYDSPESESGDANSSGSDPEWTPPPRCRKLKSSTSDDVCSMAKHPDV